jgi:ubiquinone biosynthesis protein
MERLRGFAFDDVESMHAAGIDTHALLQAGLIASLEGALIYGVFHGDLHGGNLVVEPSGRTALFDFGITGRLDEPQRLAFLRLLVLGTTGDVRGQLAALRDLGAFPPDVDLEAVIVDLDLEGPVKDPAQMSADELVKEMREITKKLLGYGARAPKELMLFVRNMMFLNSATAVLAPDLDMLQQMMQIYLYFAQTHGEQIMREVGVDASAATPDPDAMRAAFLVDADVETLTYRELRERREEIRAKLQESRRPSAMLSRGRRRRTG